MTAHPDKGRCLLNSPHRFCTRSFAAEISPASARLEPPDEVLVADVRAGLTPSDLVERKLMGLLHGAAVAGSHVRMAGLRVRGRSNDRTVGEATSAAAPTRAPLVPR